MKKKVLSISYDDAILKTRQYIFEQAGFEVVSAWGFTNALARCEDAQFDVVVLGHTLPPEDKSALASVLRRRCACPIVTIRRSAHQPIPDADYSIEAGEGPEAMVAVVRKALGV